jgi:hypothetical protein
MVWAALQLVQRVSLTPIPLPEGEGLLTKEEDE